MDIQYKNQESIYNVYARTDKNDIVTKIFSDCFEQPKPEDILLKSGRGDEFVHVGYYRILTKERAHNYKIVAGELTERTEEEIAEEIADNHKPEESDKEKLARLEKENYFLKEQQAEQDEIILETNYALLLMQESITDIV